MNKARRIVSGVFSQASIRAANRVFPIDKKLLAAITTIDSVVFGTRAR